MVEGSREPAQDALPRQADVALARLVPDEASRRQVLDRFFRQYLPALARSPASGDAERVWESFRYYITAASTSRKPFALSVEEAERVIAALAELMPGPPSGSG